MRIRFVGYVCIWLFSVRGGEETGIWLFSVRGGEETGIWLCSVRGGEETGIWLCSVRGGEETGIWLCSVRGGEETGIWLVSVRGGEETGIWLVSVRTLFATLDFRTGRMLHLYIEEVVVSNGGKHTPVSVLPCFFLLVVSFQNSYELITFVFVALLQTIRKRTVL